MAEKPRLYLVKEPTAESIADLYRLLTGREVTEERLQEIREELADDDTPPSEPPKP